jgi:hypothetical protein
MLNTKPIQDEEAPRRALVEIRAGLVILTILDSDPDQPAVCIAFGGKDAQEIGKNLFGAGVFLAMFPMGRGDPDEFFTFPLN